MPSGFVGCMHTYRVEWGPVPVKQPWRMISYHYRDQPRCAPSKWKTSLHCNDVSHWLVAYIGWSFNKGKAKQKCVDICGPFCVWTGLCIVDTMTLIPAFYSALTHSSSNSDLSLTINQNCYLKCFYQGTYEIYTCLKVHAMMTSSNGNISIHRLSVNPHLQIKWNMYLSESACHDDVIK